MGKIGNELLSFREANSTVKKNTLLSTKRKLVFLLILMENVGLSFPKCYLWGGEISNY